MLASTSSLSDHLRRRTDHPEPRLRCRRPDAVVAALVVLVATAGWSAGWSAQRHYLEHRYVDSGVELDTLNAYFRGVRDARVAVIGTVETYPMFGTDLSNEVVGLIGAVGPASPAEQCRRWGAVARGRYDYVVVTRYGVLYTSAPPREWFDDPAARVVLQDGVTSVYRLSGPLRSTPCA